MIKKLGYKKVLLVGTALIAGYLLWVNFPQLWMQMSSAQRELVDHISTSLFYAGQGSWGYIFGLLLATFLYGLIHSIAPGHGKTMIITMSLVNGYSKLRSLQLVSLVALLQATSACFLVFSATYFSDVLSLSLSNNVKLLTQACAVLIVLVGVKQVLTELSSKLGTRIEKGSWKPLILVGMRPCTGAILVLFFANTFHTQFLGVVSAYAMAVGTATTNSLLVYKALVTKTFMQHEEHKHLPKPVSLFLSGLLVLSGVVLFKFADVSTLNLVN